MDKNKKLENFAQSLLQKGKDSGMVWNGIAWVPVGAVSKILPAAPKIRDPYKLQSPSSTLENSNLSKGDALKTAIPKSPDALKTAIPKSPKSDALKTIKSIANEIVAIKKSLFSFIKSEEKAKKKSFEDNLKEKNEAYAAKYKKTIEKKPEKISEEPKKSFFEFLKDLFKNILKFFAVGIGLIALNKFFSIGDVKDTIKNLIVKILTTVSDLIIKGSELIHEILKPGETSNKIIGFIEKIIYSVIQVVSDFIGFIKEFVQKVATDDKLLGNIQSIIENIVITLFTVIKVTIESLKNVFETVGPELTEGIIKGIVFLLEGIASGIQFLTALVNNKEFRKGFADVFQAVYDLISAIFDIDVPVPVFGTVKLGTIVAIVVGTMAALDLAFKGLLAFLVLRTAKRGLKAGASLAGKTECSGVLGGTGKTGKSGKPGKGRKILDALGGGVNVLQAGGLIAGAATAAYVYADTSERGEELRKRYEIAPDDEKSASSAAAPTTDSASGSTPTLTPTDTYTSTSAPAPASTAMPTSMATPTATSASAPVPPPMPAPSSPSSPSAPTSSAATSASSDAMKKMVIQSGSNMQLIEAALKRRGLSDPTYIKSVQANVMKESGGKPIAENLNYGSTSNERIRKIFGSRAARYSDAQLDQIKKSDQMMGELMYGYETDVGRRMGNTQPGDGFLYRGRGFIQLSGKSNYAAASRDIYGDDRLVKNPDLLLDPTVAAESTAWYMQQGRARMAKTLGIGTENLSQEQSDLLATSQIAGGDIRKKGAIGQEIISKVASYSGGSKALYAGSDAGASPVASAGSVQNFSPMGPMPSTPPTAGMTGQGPDLSSPFGLLSNIVGSASKAAGDTVKNLSDPEKFPTMTSGGIDMGKFLDTASEDLKKMLQDNELIGAFFKDQTINAGNSQRKDVVATNTTSSTNPEINSGIGSVYDEEFVKKVFA